MDELLKYVYENGNTHFQEMSGGQVNATELVAALICKKKRSQRAFAMYRKLWTVP